MGCQKVLYSMLFVIISILLLVPYSLLFLYYRKGWKSIPDFSFQNREEELRPFITVVIPARNEADRIGRCLEALRQQDYPAAFFEIIVVNDFSEDNTSQIVRDFAKDFAGIRLVELKEYLTEKEISAYKKKAIEIAISISRGDLIITTDADCIALPTWISSIAGFQQKKGAEMIAAPVSILLPRNSRAFKKPLYIFQILDFMTMQGITGAALQRKFHYMANGANFSYTKNLFHLVGGFDGVDDIASGDDMLLIDKASRRMKDKIHYLKCSQAIVSTFPENTFKLFLHQRIRWASKSSKYQDYKIKSILALIYLLNAWILIVAVSAFMAPKLIFLLIGILIIKVFAELVFLYPVSKFFHQQRLLWWFVPLQPFHILYIIIAGWFGAFGNYRWKGRKIVKPMKHS